MPQRWLTPRRLRLHAMALLAALWGVTAVNLATRGAVTLNGHLKGEDYAHFYALGRIALAHDASDLYDSAAQTATIAGAIPDARPPTFVPVYGPQVALFFAVFAVVPYLVSLTLWWTVSTAVYLACCWQFWRRSPALAGAKPRFFLFALAYPGFWELIVHGQTSVLVLACFTLLWTALRDRNRPRHLLGGIALGLLFYKPQMGIAATVVLLASAQWRVLTVAALTVVVQFAAAWAWFGWEAIAGYIRMLRLLPAVADLLEPNLSQMCSLRGVVQLLGVPEPWGLAAYAAASSIVLAVLVHSWRTRPPAVGVALLLLATILVAPHATVYDLVILAPALILLANKAAAASPVHVPWLYAAYLAPLSGGLAALTHVQLIAPVLCVLFWTVVRTTRASPAVSA
ncbi:MAG: glycosyltransferase family 87 protein [Acidobacteriota bacterium]